MRLIQINTVCNESTGKIMCGIQRYADQHGFQTLSLYGRRKGAAGVLTRKVGDGVSFWCHVALTTATDLHGLGSILETRRLVRILRKEQPDIIHLHNIHGYYLNYPILFRYLREEFKGHVFWTLHDCWSFTGHCAYYVLAGCDRWQSGCHDCPSLHQYPWSYGLDNSRYNYRRKKETFTGLSNMTLLVPSRWLRDQVQQSFLKEYETIIVPNGIDTGTFHYMEDPSIRARYGIPMEHIIILSVASHWDDGKGIKTLQGIAENLPQGCELVIVGGQVPGAYASLPRVHVIERTADVEELVRIYSMADVFLNPSVQETFSMVTIEAMACEIPVIAVDSSAVSELVTDECGVVLHNPAIPDYMQAIHTVLERSKSGQITRKALRERAEQYTVQRQMDQVIGLYRQDGI